MRKAFLAACMLAGATLPAQAWDYPGHRIVGAIADMVLQQHHKDTFQRLHRLIDQHDWRGNVTERRTLREVAVFPDCARNDEEYCGRKPTAEEIDYVLRNLVHKSFHFTNTPFQQKTYLARGVGASDTDVVQMITHAFKQLSDKKQPFKPEVKLTDAEAIWLLAHLVGDIHQPLHVGQIYFDSSCKVVVNPNDPNDRDKGHVSTFGGNSIKFEPKAPTVPPAPSLHIYWDSTAVARAMHADGYADAEQAFAKSLALKPPPKWETDGTPDTWAEKWVAEVLPVAAEAYTRKDLNIDGKLDSQRGCQWTAEIADTYEKWAQDRAREQLQKAGFRLAAILVEALKPKP